MRLAALCVLAAWGGRAHACRYNVREVGFIDTGIEPYTLFVHLPRATPPEEIDDLKDVVDVALADTNIRWEPVPAEADANHPAAVLVSPDGPSRNLVLPTGDQSLVEAVSLSLAVVLESPTRRQILEKAAECYGVVLLIEGPQQDENGAAREAVSAAISYISERLEYLPKAIARGPAMVVLDHASLAREEMLLWTLGLTPQDVNEPCAAIYYGRGRWIGPLFKGEMLTDENLLRVLPVIGADCECGLDHRWLQGTMLPARWDQSLQQRVAANLGFDPESPMVKMEMMSIVRRGMSGFDHPGAPSGGQEMEVGGEPADSLHVPVPEANDVTVVAETKPANVLLASQATAGGVDVVPPRMGGIILAASFGGMLVLVAGISAVVLLRAKRD